ncbi:cytochrome P450 [Pseudonocardia sulfidoxydans NBRC 16205]|uniref:Cytochrome P450 n=3 Tax=Pseudonocardia sulfidoxydans TaxID=54011 RepID=A0A511DHS1_9PSEU|nr:cytochrome P450 [Pseudonocardia sulfidoxydans NBRC 16205]
MTVTDLTTTEFVTDPYTAYGRMREEAPVLRGTFFGGAPVWVVTRYDDVRAVLGDPTHFANDPAAVPGSGAADLKRDAMVQIGIPEDLLHYLTDSIISADGAHHTRLRKLVSRAFTVRRVGELRPRVEAITAALLDRLEKLGAGGTPVDLVEEFAYPLPITVICELVGIPETDREAWHAWSKDLATMDRERIPTALRDMVDHILSLVACRRAEPADDLLTALVRVADADGDRLSDDELVTMILSLVIAGHETTAHLISNAVVALLTRPDQLAALRADPELWPGAIAELMRRSGPVQFASTRYALADTELGGVKVKAGEGLQPALVAANSDPREFDDPERLDVARRTAERGEGHVGFGFGPHYCLGAALARQEGEVALRVLVERFPDLALAVDPGELVWLPVPGMRRLSAVPLRLRCGWAELRLG